ncbi:MAG: flippase [Chloroflexi bacterium]|nr:flippase [Chloroflexota bacterium]
MKAELGAREAAAGLLPVVVPGPPHLAAPLARIAKNFVSLAAASGVVAVGAFILNVLVARSFGLAEFGQYRFALAFVALFHTLYHLGVGFLIIRDVARDKSLAARALGAGIAMSLVLGLLALVLIALVVAFISYSPSTKMLILLLAIAQLPYTLTLLGQAIFRAFERMELEMVVSALGTAATLLLLLVVLRSGGGVASLGLVHLAASLVTLVVALVLVRIFFTKVKAVWDLRYFRYLGFTSIPFALNGIVLPVYFRIDVILVAALRDEAAVGLYSAAVTLAAPLSFIADNAANAIFPPLASAFVSSKRSYHMLLTTVWKWSLPLLVCLGIVMTLLARTVLLRVFGSTYIEAATAFQVLVWASIISYFNGLFFRALEASNRQVYVTVILGVGAVANLLLGLWLISAFGIVGAAIAFLVTQAIILLVTRAAGTAFNATLRVVRGPRGGDRNVAEELPAISMGK